LGSAAVVGRLTTVGNLDGAAYNIPLGYQVVSVLDVTVANSVALQDVGSGEQALVGGLTTLSETGESDALLFRLTSNGLLDTGSFGVPNGYVLISVPADVDIPTTLIQQLEVQPADQFIVAVGSYIVDSMSNLNPFLLRTDASGTLDSSFGSGGIVLPGVETPTARGIGVTLQPSNGFVVTVTATTDGTGTMLPLVHRFDTTGAPDSSFGTAGAVLINGFGSMAADDLALQSDESIIVAAHTDQSVHLVRLTPAGVVDTTFGTDGMLSFSFPGQELVLLPNSLIVNADDGLVIVMQNQNVGNSMVAKATSAGVADSTFGTGGILVVDQVTPGSPLVLTSIDGDSSRFVAVGSSGAGLCAIAFKQSETTAIAIKAPADGSTLTTNQLSIYGTSTQSDSAVQITIDGTPVSAVVVTNSRGDWSFGVTEPLSTSTAPGTPHTIVANLIYDVNSVVATASATINLQTP
jgi:uncharacterized delta-60 repeat protein